MRVLFIGLILVINLYQLSAQCFTDRHSTILSDGWIGCETSASPNADRGESIWIMYDFGDIRRLGTSHFWNINTPGYTNMGAQEIIIDYSLNGNEWTEWGSYLLDQGTASSYYQGQEGPDFEGLGAQYLLFTIVSNYGSSCGGLAEIKVEDLGSITDIEDIASTKASLEVSPNPASELTFVKYASKRSGNAVIRVLNSIAQEVKRMETNIQKGDNILRLELIGLPSGIYTVQLRIEEQNFVGQLSVKK